MSQLAAIIFAGRVVAVQEHLAANGATGYVEIEFAIEDAVRGVTTHSYTLKQWTGLDLPLHVGERYLMFLYAPGVAGLNAPVGGADGCIPIREAGPETQVNSEVGSGESSKPGATSTVDLRWLATRVPRHLESPVQDTALPATHISSAMPKLAQAGTAASVRNAQRHPAVNAATATEPASPALPYSTVLKLLHTWERTDANTR